MAFTLTDFEPVLRALQDIKHPPHAWVGGQAIIVWANRFLTTEEIAGSGLKVPLTSNPHRRIAQFGAGVLTWKAEGTIPAWAKTHMK